MDPDGDARCLSQPDGIGAAGAVVSDERSTGVRAQGDHLRVAAVPGRPPIPAPVGGVPLGEVAGGAGGVGGGYRVGSAGTRATHEDDARGGAGLGSARGLLDSGHVIPGVAAGHQEPERLAHDCSPPMPAPGPACDRADGAGDGSRLVRAGYGVALVRWQE